MKIGNQRTDISRGIFSVLALLQALYPIQVGAKPIRRSGFVDGVYLCVPVLLQLTAMDEAPSRSIQGEDQHRFWEGRN